MNMINEYRKENKKNKFNLKLKKDNAIKSLKQVECLLENLNKASKCGKLYKILKK